MKSDHLVGDHGHLFVSALLQLFLSSENEDLAWCLFIKKVYTLGLYLIYRMYSVKQKKSRLKNKTKQKKTQNKTVKTNKATDNSMYVLLFSVKLKLKNTRFSIYAYMFKVIIRKQHNFCFPFLLHFRVIN